MYKLFVVGFSRETDELELNELFCQQGLVKHLTIIRDQYTGASKGYAFVQMLDEAGAERAIQHFDRFKIGDRILSVRYANTGKQANFDKKALMASAIPASASSTVPIKRRRMRR